MKSKTLPFQWQHTINQNKVRLLDTWVTGHAVLDIGCGTGFYSSYMHQAGKCVTAIDQENRYNGSIPCRFVQGTVPPLPFADKAFDSTLLFDVLEHVEQESMLLEEIRRVTRSRILLSVPATDKGDLSEFGLCLSHNLDKTHLRTYERESLSRTLIAHGFTVLHMEPQCPVKLPFACLPFFKPRLTGHVAKLITKVWFKVLIKCGIIEVDLTADWLAVAEPRR